MLVEGMGAAGAEVRIGWITGERAVLGVRVIGGFRMDWFEFGFDYRTCEAKARGEFFAGAKFEAFREFGAIDTEEFAEFSGGVRFEALAAEETDFIGKNTNTYSSLGERGFRKFGQH